MLKYSEGDVKAGQVKIHYYRTGDSKPPLILLHGATDNGLCWTPVAEKLAREYDVIMPDAQGHGLSDRIDRGFRFEKHADQVIALIQQLEITKPVIMGHSMGAGTAVNIAVKQPHLPKAIILEDPAWRTSQGLAAEITTAAAKQLDVFMKMLTGYRQRPLKEIGAECRNTNPFWSEAEIIPWAQSKLQFDPVLFSKMPINHPSYTELVPQIQCPTLLIISDGGIVSEETARHASTIWASPNPFRWIQIQGAGHNIRREQFALYMDAVSRFLQETS